MAAGKPDTLDWLFALDHREGGLERQIYRQARDAILARRLPPGTRLPASRALAASLGLSRGTVVAAFEQLIAEGYLQATVGRGTAVAALPAELLGKHGQTGHADRSVPAPSSRGIQFARTRTGAIDVRCFRAGTPSLDDFPYRDWARCLTARARNLRAADLSYANPTGMPALRNAIVGYLSRARGVVAAPEQVVIVPSAQAGFVVAAHCTTERGDTIAVEDPGYNEANTAFAASGATLAPVPVDAEGIDVQSLAHVEDFKLVSTTPSHQHPTGVTMSLDRRLRLLDLVRARGACVLEDDYDSEFHYAERPIASLQGIDGGRNVIYLGTFSKALAPGIRVAYLVLPPTLAASAGAIATGLGEAVSSLTQLALADFIEEGYFTAHIGRMRHIYAAKSAALIAALDAHLPAGCTFTPPRGGLQILVRLPERADDMAIRADLHKEGLEAQPLSPLAIRYKGKGLVLGFARARDDEIAPAARRLCEVVARRLTGP